MGPTARILFCFRGTRGIWRLCHYGAGVRVRRLSDGCAAAAACASHGRGTGVMAAAVRYVPWRWAGAVGASGMRRSVFVHVILNGNISIL